MLSSSYSPFSNSTTAPRLRHPRGIVLLNDIPVSWINIEVITTTFYIADSYRVTIPLSGQPLKITTEYLASTNNMTIKIYLGFPKNPLAFTTQDLDLFMIGDVDKLDIDPLNKVATFMGRDYTSRFIDTKTYIKYPNQSAASIATQLANAHGLIPEVEETSASLQKVGTFYANENTLINKETTEWDLLCFLAQQIDFVCFVSSLNPGPSLIFKQRIKTSPTPTGITPYLLTYEKPTAGNASPGFNGVSLSFSRSLTLAKDVIVKVRVPVNPQTGHAFTRRAMSSQGAEDNAQVYAYTFPGLTPQQAQFRANQLLTDITLHELRLEAVLPGDNVLRKDSLIQVEGTGTSLDQLYYSDQVVRTMQINEGYTMHISAKNHNVDSEVSL